MSSGYIPTIQCVYTFKNELDELTKCFKEPNSAGVYCYLYGLWTHSSNVVVHMVVSTKPEFDYVKKHSLDCVGYAAECYTAKSCQLVHQSTKISSSRQHIVIDVDNTKRSGDLHAYAMHLKILKQEKYTFRQGNFLQTNILPNQSPFRTEFYRIHPALKPRQNNENETSFGSNMVSCEEEFVGQKQRSEGWTESLHSEKQLHITSNGVGSANMNGNVMESETVSCLENQMNGHHESISLIQKLKHRIKREFDLGESEPVEEIYEPPLRLHFQHGGKQWMIWWSLNKANGKMQANIQGSEVTGDHCKPVKAPPHDFYTNQTLLEIRKLCQCEKCITIATPLKKR